MESVERFFKIRRLLDDEKIKIYEEMVLLRDEIIQGLKKLRVPLFYGQNSDSLKTSDIEREKMMEYLSEVL